MTTRNDLIVGMSVILITSMIINLLLQWLFNTNYTILHIYGFITLILNVILIVRGSLVPHRNEDDTNTE